MVFDKIKNKIQQRRELSQEKKELDNLVREKARARAEEEYKQKRLEDRQRYMEEREEKLYQQELKKQGKTGYEDTRTRGEKFKEGVSKVGSNLGTVGGKVTEDTRNIVSNIPYPKVSNFGRATQGSLTEEQPYQTPLPRMSKNRESLPETPQNNMFFRSGGMYDDTERLNNNMNVFSQKLYNKSPGSNMSIFGSSGFMKNGKFSNLGLGNDKTETKLRNFLK